MHVESLSCGNCGAPLDVQSNINYVTCAHCGSRLVIRRTENSAYTEVLTDIKKDTGEILRHTDTIRRQNRQIASEMTRMRLEGELKELDDRWSASARKWIDAFPRGTTSIPRLGELRSERNFFAGILIISVVLLLAEIAGIHVSSGTIAWEIGILTVVIIVSFYAMRGFNHEISLTLPYRAAEDDYRRRRANIVERIGEIEDDYQVSRKKRPRVKSDPK
jgi:DNA-directed RNA polymerase subunit RPC12/RpoP